MPARRLFALCLLMSILPVVPLAYATPIDPSWPGGFYDNGDLDDVIQFIVSGVATVAPLLLSELEPRRIVIGRTPDAEPAFVPGYTPSARHSRAPPLP